MADYDPYNSLVPIFRETRIPRKVEQIATAVFISHPFGYFLFTAAHVTDDMETETLFVPAGGQITEINGYVGHIDLLPGSRREDDNIDIAYIKIPQDFIPLLRKHFVPLEGNNSELIKSALDLTVCSVSGYPSKKGKKKQNVFSSEIFSFTGTVAQQETYDELSLSPEQNIIIHYNRKKTIDPGVGEIRTSPHPKGVSGGGIFAWPRESIGMPDWSEKKLVGLFHTYKEREGLLIGTTLLPFLAAIQLGNMKKFDGVI